MNTGYVAAEYHETRTSKLVEAFGVKDGKGRELGAIAYLGTRKVTQVADRDFGSCALEADLGDWFIFYPDATRDGKSFGASHGSRKFRTEAERDAAVVAYLASARKRAVNNKAVRS